MIRRSEISYACIVLATASANAFADPEPIIDDETIVIIDRAPDEGARDRARALGEAPFVTVLHPDDHPATASVADALATSAGTLTRSLGGMGSYQSVSVRGAAPGHTSVLIDGVPLARIASVTTDLGRFALDSFGEVELYRGAVPIELGGAGVGGAVNLVTRLGRGELGERVQASMGMGSFGARHLRAHYGDDHGDVLSSTTIGYAGATGDYTYFSDNGTLLNRSDDAYRTRGNNGFDAVDGATRFGSEDRSLAGGARVAWKRQGLPGSINSPAVDANLSTLDVIADGKVDVTAGPAIGRQLAFVLVEAQRLRDPMAELGLGAADRKYLTLSGGASSTWSIPLGAHRLAAGLELRGDRFRDRDLGAPATTQVGTRAGGALLANLDLVLAPQLVVTPAVRLDVLRSAPTLMTVDPLERVAPRWDVVPSPRLSTRSLVTSDLAIKASGGWYARLPTLLEVFGNRGYIIGTPDLEPERGPSADAGFVWAPAVAKGTIDRILVSANAFANRAHDTIAIITYAGFVARAENIGTTQGYGAELIASGRLAKTVSLTASYTRLVTEQLSADPSLDGKQIPRRPGHVLYARTDVVRSLGGHVAEIWLDGAWQAESALDAANLARVPGRILLGTGARVEIGGGLGLAISVANLTDDRVAYLPLDPPPSPALSETPTPLTDVAGFPLPGRSFYLSVDWTH